MSATIGGAVLGSSVSDKPIQLQVESLTVTFGGLYAVRDVSVSIKEGERVGLIGPNGAGKTTFVNAVVGDLPVRSGKVFVHGQNVSDWPAHRRFTHGLGRTFQICSPFPALTAFDAVALGPLMITRNAREAADRAMAALKVLNVDSYARLPMRSLNQVTSKLVELARLIASGSGMVVLLDELLAGLVAEERSFVMDVVDQVARDQDWTVLMIEHLIQDVRRFCPRVLVLVEGKLIADGDTEGVLRSPEVVEAYLGRRWLEREFRAKAKTSGV
jgi:ABC-type branched-subunit amino acid transport system ATPase component